MKILITSDSYLPRLGGGEIYAYQLATFLKREGHEVQIFTTEQGEWVKDFETPTHRFLLRRNPINLIRFLIIYTKLIKKADVVHAIYSYKLAAWAGLICLFTRKKLVISLQGLGTLDMPGNNWFYSKVHSIYRITSLKLCHKAIASCLEFVDIASRYMSKEKIVYLPNFVDVEEFVDTRHDYTLLPFEYRGEDLIFTIRRLVPKNGIQFAVEAMPRILEKNPNARLVAIGWGRLEEYLKNRAEELGVTDKIYFVGRIENFELRQLLSLANVVLFPSTAEATSIACLESMSLSKPIVASNVGGYPEMVIHGENGFLVNLTDTLNSNYGAPMSLSDDKLEALADSVIRVLASKEIQESFGKKSRELAEEKFSWQKNINKITDIHKEVCKT